MRYRRHNFCSKWVGASRIVDAKSESVFVVDDFRFIKMWSSSVSRMLPNPVQSWSHAIQKDHILQSEHVHFRTQLLEPIKNVHEKERRCELLVEWEGGNDQGGETWEPVNVQHEDNPGTLANFYTPHGGLADCLKFWIYYINDIL